jgi:hypothetical protein
MKAQAHKLRSVESLEQNGWMVSKDSAPGRIGHLRADNEIRSNIYFRCIKQAMLMIEGE